MQKSFVRRFAWATYPPMVRVICIGGDLETIEDKLNGPPAFYSAELCGGTHLRHTEDLMDVVIVGLRCRNQSIKEVCNLSICPVLLVPFKHKRFFGSQASRDWSPFSLQTSLYLVILVLLGYTFNSKIMLFVGIANFPTLNGKS